MKVFHCSAITTYVIFHDIQLTPIARDGYLHCGDGEAGPLSPEEAKVINTETEDYAAMKHGSRCYLPQQVFFPWHPCENLS